MDLSELDGFMAGLAASPIEVPADEWLDEVWNGETPAYANDDERGAVEGAIFKHYADVQAALDASPLAYAPILWQDASGNTVAEDWAAGFMQAVSLRPEAWKAALADDDASLLLIPIASLAQAAVEPDDRGASLPDEALDTLLEDAEQILPVCVSGLRRFWNDRTSGAGVTRH